MLNSNRTQPLAHLHLPPTDDVSDGLQLTDFGFPNFFQILTTLNQSEKAAKSLGLDLLKRTKSEFADWKIFPTTPTEWAVIGVEHTPADLQMLIGDTGFVSDQRSARNHFCLSGPNAEDILSKGCPIDVDPRIIKSGFWAQSTYNEIGVLIHKTQNTPSFDIYCYAGFAESLWHGLKDAGANSGSKHLLLMKPGQHNHTENIGTEYDQVRCTYLESDLR